jgi:hypothetical protein
LAAIRNPSAGRVGLAARSATPGCSIPAKAYFKLAFREELGIEAPEAKEIAFA